MVRNTIWLLAFVGGVAALAALACGGGSARPLPPPVEVRQEPQGIALGGPAFEAMPGATADFGLLGGAVYQIEMPDDWNGRLVLFMHGYEELAAEANVGPPDFRAYLILHGYAWGASSFSSTSSIPGRAADETAALWDFFARKYGRPERSYVTGFSMGGAATHIAAERYGDRFDGALGQCGSAGQSPGAATPANHFVAGAYVAGVTQADYDAADDPGALIEKRILLALEDPAAHEQFENILIDLTGGPRAFDREGLHFEEPTNWERARLLITPHLADNRGVEYEPGPVSGVNADEFNRAAVRFSVNEELLREFTAGEDTTGELQTPLLALYTTGDGQVPIEQARILRRRVEAAGKGSLLVQRVYRDPGHCGFTTAEQEDAFEALVAWVEEGERPAGDDVLIDDLRGLTGAYELTPRGGTPEADAVAGAEDRVVVRGTLRLDGATFDARWVGAVVLRDGLAAPCQYTLPQVEDGRYEITVAGDAESNGCGAPGAEILLWTFVGGQRLSTLETVAWPGDGGAVTFDGTFSASSPEGKSRAVTELIGEVFDRGGDHMAPGTRVEAYVGDVLCGVASTRRTGSFSGFILSIVGPESVAGCELGATVMFRVDGQEAAQTAVNGGDEPSETLDLTIR
jgi:dienelactone hydrolase